MISQERAKAEFQKWMDTTFTVHAMMGQEPLGKDLYWKCFLAGIDAALFCDIGRSHLPLSLSLKDDDD